MDLLESLILCLDDEAADRLHAFIQTQRRSEREAVLLRLMREHPAERPKTLAAKLYQPVNMNAYYSLKKRLLNKTINYVAAQRIHTDSASPDALVALVLVARWLIDHNQPAAALFFLKKAEAEAAALKRYALLENIYLIYIDHAGLLHINAAEVCARWEVNAHAYTTFRKLKIAAALIHDQFEAVRESGFPPEPDAIIQPVLKAIQITSEEANNPNFQLTLATIIRRAYASVKRYEPVERFVSRVYRRLVQTQAFTPAQADVQAQFLYMQTHALYRIRSFARCLEVVAELQAVIARQSGKWHPLWARSVMLEAAVYAYTRRNERSIALLEDCLQRDHARIEQRDLINMRLNLAVYHFNATNYRAANRVLSQINYSDARIDRVMGKEWRFKRGMIALIVQFELGHAELALLMIQRLQKEFGRYLRHPAYERADAFLACITRMINRPEEVNTDAFRATIKASSMMLNTDRDDLQGIVFFCWLRSKMFRRPYYDVLVERLNQSDELVLEHGD